MSSDNITIYPLCENIKTFTHIYQGILEETYEKSYLDTLVKLSKVFYNSMERVLYYKFLLNQRNKELEDPNICNLTKLGIECELLIINGKLDYLLSRNSDCPYDDSYTEISQEILQFYFDSLE